MITRTTTRVTMGLFSAAFLLWGTQGLAVGAQGSGRPLRSAAEIEAEQEQELRQAQELELEQESETETEIEAADADGDGIPDAVEIEHGLDPANADTDHDGIADGIDPDPLHPAMSPNRRSGRGR